MFSKILRSAKSALQPSAPVTLQYPETNLFPSTPAPKTPARSDMVTTRTRSKAAAESEVEISTPSAQIQASTRKRTREAVVSTPSINIAEVEPSSSSAKKQKITTTVTKLQSHAEIPVKDVVDLESIEEAEENEPVMPSPKGRRSLETKDKASIKEQNSLDQARLPGKEPMSTISLLSDDEDQPRPTASLQPLQSLLSEDEDAIVQQPRPSPKNIHSSATKSKSPKINKSVETSQVEKENNSIDSEQKVSEEPVTLPARKHHRFGSVDPVLEIPSSDPNDHDEINDSEEESSDDEAPEEVGTREAAEEAKQIIRAAAKAVEEQKAIERRVRQERDVALKKQAKSNKKRKRGKEVEKVERVEYAETNALDTVLDEAPASNQVLAPKIDKSNLPDLLPLEYLEDEDFSTNSDILTITESTQPKSKKIKFLDLVEKRPKDKKKGSTTFKVREKAADARLAPKASKAAMSTKEAWLSGGVRKNRSGNVRKPMKRSFLVR